MKTNKKIALAAMSLVAASVAAAGATGTFAWFSVNRTVNVTGMTVNTKVTNNLLIAPANPNNSYNNNAESAFVEETVQTRTGYLQPTSTIDGQNFFYTAHAAADGSALAGNEFVAYSEDADFAEDDNEYAGAGKLSYDADFQVAYDNEARTKNHDHDSDPATDPVDDGYVVTAANRYFGYIDYNFYLKATVATANSEISLTKANMKYNTKLMNDADGQASSNILKAWRLALLVRDYGSTNTKYDGTAALTKKEIITNTASAGNFIDGKAVNAAAAPASARDTVSYDAAKMAENLTVGVHYYYVVVRLWLEGEDKACNNETYANLNNGYTLDLEFELDTANETTPIPAITSVA